MGYSEIAIAVELFCLPFSHKFNSGFDGVPKSNWYFSINVELFLSNLNGDEPFKQSQDENYF